MATGKAYVSLLLFKNIEDPIFQIQLRTSNPGVENPSSVLKIQKFSASYL